MKTKTKWRRKLNEILEYEYLAKLWSLDMPFFFFSYARAVD